MSQARSPEGTPESPTARLEAIAQKLLTALSPVRVVSLSFHDEDADVLWLTESVLGPDEHEAVRSSMEIFAGQGAPARHEHDLGDGRVAITWRASHKGSAALGVLMLIVDQRSIADPKLRRADSCVAEAVTGFAEWLAADLSATQLRLRALPDLSAPEPDGDGELELAIIDYTPPAPPPSAAAPAEAQAASAAPVANAMQAAHAAKPAVGTPVIPVLAAAATTAQPVKVTSIDPSLERHFQALRAQPIVLFAQQLEPLTEESRIPRYEILLRTGSEHGRSQAPVAMLEAAARKGLGSVLDRRVITDLIVWLSRSAEAWHANPISVTVNLSSTSLVDAHFLKFLEACLTKSGLPRGMIGFELDASVCAQQRQRSAEFAEVLASLGCKLVLDNFALQDGHVELLDLKGLRMLKLHPLLTSSMLLDTRRQAVVAGIAQMACVLGMYTCAKSIESEQFQPLLAKLKVDFVQGFAYSMPRPLDELAFGDQAVAAAR